ncbi:hypothetical protein G7046_g3097 [Stylonectria norvegica]|nr:hypothetical protein G7046_g3097 [Stylonectria norvegica]
MKLNNFAIWLLPAVLGAPVFEDAFPGISRRQSVETVADELLFSITLPQFTVRRNARDPATLDWTSDGCSLSPDNPFGFPFQPCCNRHDFGYNNYRLQKRFTESAKLRIDTQFKTDLYYQCRSVTAQGVCKALADVYYAAVRAFGGSDASPGRRGDNLIDEYERRLVIYNQLVEEAQKNGELPVLEVE